MPDLVDFEKQFVPRWQITVHSRSWFGRACRPAVSDAQDLRGGDIEALIDSLRRLLVGDQKSVERLDKGGGATGGGGGGGTGTKGGQAGGGRGRLKHSPKLALAALRVPTARALQRWRARQSSSGVRRTVAGRRAFVRGGDSATHERQVLPLARPYGRRHGSPRYRDAMPRNLSCIVRLHPESDVRAMDWAGWPSFCGCRMTFARGCAKEIAKAVGDAAVAQAALVASGLGPSQADFLQPASDRVESVLAQWGALIPSPGINLNWRDGPLARIVFTSGLKFPFATSQLGMTP